MLNVLDEFRRARLAFADAYRDATRHDQMQLFDAMIVRGEDFINRALYEICTVDAKAFDTLISGLDELRINEGSMSDRERGVANAVELLEGHLIKKGFLVATTRDSLVPADIAPH